MPRLSETRLPKIQHHKARNRARVNIAGKKYDLGVYGSPESIEKYNALIAEYLKLRDNPDLFHAVHSPSGQSALSVAELVEKFLDYAKEYYGPKSKSYIGYRDAVNQIPKPIMALAVDQFSPLKLQAFQEVLAAKGQALRTVNLRVGLVKYIFKWGASQEIVSTDIVNALYTVRNLQKGRSQAKETKAVRPVERRHVESTLTETSSVISAMVRITLHCGCRPSETCIMRACDIDRTRAVWIYVPHSHKTKDRTGDKIVFIGKAGQEILQPFLDGKAPEEYLFSPKDAIAERYAKATANRKSEYKSPSRIARDKKRAKQPKAPIRDHYDTDSFSGAVERAIERYNRKAEKSGAEPVPEWNLNQLRHLRGTEIRSRRGLETAQIALGHAHADVTLIYAERDLKKGIEVFQDLND